MVPTAVLNTLRYTDIPPLYQPPSKILMVPPTELSVIPSWCINIAWGINWKTCQRNKNSMVRLQNLQTVNRSQGITYLHQLSTIFQTINNCYIWPINSVTAIRCLYHITKHSKLESYPVLAHAFELFHNCQDTPFFMRTSKRSLRLAVLKYSSIFRLRSS